MSLTIKVEPTPDGDQELVGDFSEEQQFMGRTFSLSLTLFKEAGAKGSYRLRACAGDDEKVTRQTSFFSSFPEPRQLNPISIDVDSRGQPEEISYQVSISYLPE